MQHFVNACQENSGGNMVLATEGTLTVATRQNTSAIKVSGRMRSDARLAFNFTVIVSA